VPVLAAVSLMASRGEATPRTLTMMGGPIDARRSPTAVNNLAMNKSLEWFENNVLFKVPTNYPGSQRRVYPGFMQHTGFIAMNPERHMRSHYDYYLDLMRGEDENADFHRNFYDEYNAVLDMPAEYYLDTIRVVFQDFSLVNGTWDVNGERVRPQDITTSALLTIEGELDDISGAGQTRAAHELCTGLAPGRKFHYDVVGAGHYGIFSGRRWREKVYPELREFIASHQDASKALAAPRRSALNGVRPVDATVKPKASVTATRPRPGTRAVAQAAAVKSPSAKRTSVASPAAAPKADSTASTKAKSASKSASKASAKTAVKKTHTR
jgi:poly(3-hydroxybutyrate) depolymerase